MDLDLDGRVALVTGGTRGIGRAVALALLNEGCRVFVTGSSPESAERARQQFSEFGDRFDVGAGRLEEADTPGRLVTAAVERFGELNLVVNNAGFYAYKTYEEF